MGQTPQGWTDLNDSVTNYANQPGNGTVGQAHIDNIAALNNMIGAPKETPTAEIETDPDQKYINDLNLKNGYGMDKISEAKGNLSGLLTQYVPKAQEVVRQAKDMTNTELQKLNNNSEPNITDLLNSDTFKQLYAETAARMPSSTSPQAILAQVFQSNPKLHDQAMKFIGNFMTQTDNGNSDFRNKAGDVPK